MMMMENSTTMNINLDKEEKYFPIKTNPACQLKWNWSTLWLTTGLTNSCHRCKLHPIDFDNFDNFHNTEFKKKEREIMLSGKWPTVANGGSGHCEYCKKVEDVGGVSDRLYHKSIPNQSPPELAKNLTAVTVTPRILEVFLNNTCNLQCVYCTPRESSKIFDENTRFLDESGLNIKTLNNNSYDIIPVEKHLSLVQKLLVWLEKNAHTLKRLHLLGGEPFYQKEFFAILDVLERCNNPNLELNIISNLMIAPARFKKITERIQLLVDDGRIGRYDVTASIDAWGPEQEYARFGLNIKLWEENFSYLVNQKWITMHINQTITSLTIKSMPKLIEKLNQYRQTVDITHQFNMVIDHNGQYLHPDIFSYQDTWAKDFNQILNMMSRDNTWREKEYQQMQGFALELEKHTKTKWDQVQNLHQFLTEIDRRRKTNWKKVFPYLNVSEY